MALSDQEIEHLREKAQSHEIVSGLPNLEQALKCYTKIIDNVTPHPHYYFKRSKVKYALAHASTFYDLAGAIEDMDRAIELEPDKGEYYRLRGEYLMLKLTEERYVSDEDRKLLMERIVGNYRACKERNPTDPQLWLDLIEVSILSHDFDKAIGFYGDCKHYMDTKEDHLVRSWLGCIALALAGDPIEEEDTEPLRQGVGWEEIDKKRLLLRFIKINTFLDAFHKGKVNKGVSKNLREVQWLFGRRFCEAEGLRIDRDSTSAHYNKSIEMRPVDDMELIYLMLVGDRSYKIAKLAKYFISETVHAKSVKHDDGLTNSLVQYDKALQLKPDDAGSWYKKGVLLNYLERCEEALRAYEKVVMHGNLALASAAWHNQGVILAELERYEEALEAYDKAIRASVGDTSLATVGWYNKGHIYCRLRRYEKAVGAYDKSITLNQNFVEAWYEKAQILKHLSRYDEAIYAYDKSINARPYYTILRPFFPVACMNEMKLCDCLNRYEDGLEAIEKALMQLGEQSEALWLPEGHLLQKLERYEEALGAYDQAIACSKDRNCIDEAWYKKACIHSIKANKDDALEDLSNAIKINAKYRDKAQKDEAFKDLWDDEDFKRIVG